MSIFVLHPPIIFYVYPKGDEQAKNGLTSIG